MVSQYKISSPPEFVRVVSLTEIDLLWCAVSVSDNRGL